MHRIALIQNESEMMRYSWADIRPMISKLGYRYDSYVSETIDELFSKLNFDVYDAIVIASNACNDTLLKSKLEKNSNKIRRFLGKGKGLLLSFQMKMPDCQPYAFFPDNLKVSAMNRLHIGESPLGGNLAVGPGSERHTILKFPLTIDLKKIKNRALSNNLVDGVYWIYLIPEQPKNWDIVIEDDSVSPRRPLLLVSRSDFSCRVLVSALALDWQRHDDLWENSLRYVVEGRPTVSVLSRSGYSSYDFQYILSSLRINKTTFTEYSLDSLSKLSTHNIPFDIYDTFLLDPNWNSDEIKKFINIINHRIVSGRAKVIYFNQFTDRINTVEIISNEREFHTISKNAILWLIAQFPGPSEKAYWGGSFWITVDVINTFVAFKIPLEQFRNRIIKEIENHDLNGSYDEVLGATCAMYQIYHLLLGKDHKKTKRTLEWILSHLPNKTLFEKATAFDILINLGEQIEEKQLIEFKNEVSAFVLSVQNEFTLYRYGKSLLTCGFQEEAKHHALKLRELQDERSGKWVNVPHTAAIIEFLISLQQQEVNPNLVLDGMIFRGIEYLRSSYSPEEFNWKSDISATAKSLKALKLFEQKISFPADFVISIIKDSEYKSKNFVALDTSTKLNLKLQQQIDTEQDKVKELEDEKKVLVRSSNFARSIGALLSLFVFLFLSYSVLYINFLLSKNRLDEFINSLTDFTKKSFIQTIAPIIALIIIAILILILKRLNKLPKFISSILPSFIEVKDE